MAMFDSQISALPSLEQQKIIPTAANPVEHPSTWLLKYSLNAIFLSSRISMPLE